MRTVAQPPRGYVPCSENCGRWTNSGKCWTCCALADGHPNDVYQSPDTPDWAPAITARDDEHRAELLKLQDDLLAGANREVAMEATIEQLGKDAATLATENDRLKAELAECEAALQLGREGIQAYCDSENAMREKLDRAVELVREFATTRACLCSATHGGMSAENHYKGCRVLAFLAATPPPAESRCTASAGSCNSPKSCGEAGSCIDARMREVVTPAESTPVQPGMDMGVPGSERTVHRCTGCDWTLNTTAMTEDVITDHVHDHLRKAHAMEPAPPDDIRERPSMYPGPGTAALQRILADHERRLASLEAKGEPGAHACDCQEEYCQLRSGLPLTAAHPVHCKGAKP